MKVTIIGNGFDLRHGLKTTYKDFFNYYTLYCNVNNLIYTYLSNKNNGFNWVDLENDLLIMFEDLSDLKNNISIREKSNSYVIDKREFNKTMSKINLYNAVQYMNYSFFSIDNYNSSLEIKNPMWYELLIENVDRDYREVKLKLFEYLLNVQYEMDSKFKLLESNEIDIIKSSERIFSFNYTNTPEKYVGSKLNYVHGSLNDEIILGIPFSRKMDIKKLHSIFKISQSIKMKKNSIIYKDQREKLELFFIGFSFGESDHYFFQEVKDWITKYTLNDYTKMPPIYFNFYYHNEDAISDYLYNLRVFLGEEMLTRFDISKRINFIAYEDI
ncbi:AbiH family protein [Fusibacter bizertensis]|uniref:AbiH family protein n=1 Tax=Fusibacter bizertensis TaxID=1488331 RepID=A0ABT6N970_9FIRM|nr:AbiH family protein [Fusibacter bizertensis]MDH8676960.1 AbiH family protein [Fusibacter bizertensis]